MRNGILVYCGFMAATVFGFSFEPRLINGTPADPKDWPASVYASMDNARCTATVVGERVLIIAAHCVAEASTVSFSVGSSQFQGRCTASPDYQRDETADWALCLLESTVDGIPYESLNTDPNALRVGDDLTLTGYGCTEPGGGGGNDGIYRIGKARITQVPSTTNDIVTEGGAALCFGDSGGPAFIGEGARRRLVSINSRGDIEKESYLVSVSTEMARQFVGSWAQTNGQKICGIDPQARGCRSY